MKIRDRFAGVLLLSFAPAIAGGMGPLWIFPVGRLCVSQEARYGDTLLGRLIIGGRLKLVSPEFTQCAKAKHWIPDRICAELMSLDNEASLSRSNLERLGEEWSDELDVLKVAGPYVIDASEAENAGKKLPACP